MAINLNRVEVVGNLTRDPELRYTPNGKAVAGFAVATNRRYQDPNGTWVDGEVEFHEVVVWDRLAEGCNKALKKGDRVFVTGRLATRSWEGQDGAKRTKTEMVADTVIGPDQVNRASFGDGPAVRPAAAPAAAAPQSAPAAAPAAPAGDDDINIEDIPF